ncbi:MAG: hypothetical protein FJ095_08395 [Deltaproteobacteria bacterium]|nr:hypothetical protein [Deltaproteobacteria bacterium]
MKNVIVVLSVLLAACAPPLRTVPVEDTSALASSLRLGLPRLDESAPMSLPGDYAVYRLSGSYRSEPATVVQRVVSRRAGLLVLDVTIEDAERSDTLRLRVDDGARRGELLSVGRLSRGRLEPYGVAAYEARMAELVPAADDSEGELGRNGEVFRVGATSLFALRTDYRVSVGVQHGTLTTYGVSGFPGETLGGKLVTDDGTVVYHAQLVELGNQQPNTMPSGRALATSPADLYEEIEE